MKRRERQALAALWHEPGLCRRDLSEQLEWRPNTTGDVIRSLLAQEILVEGRPSLTGGRPKTPLYLDRNGRTLLGLSISLRRVECVRVNVLGEVVSEKFYKSVENPKRLDFAARALFEKTLTPDCLGAGVVVSEEVIKDSRENRGAAQSCFLTRLQSTLSQVEAHCPVTLARSWRVLASQSRLSNDRRKNLLFLWLGKQEIHSFIATQDAILKVQSLGELRAPEPRGGKVQSLNTAWSVFQKEQTADGCHTQLPSTIFHKLAFQVGTLVDLLKIESLVLSGPEEFSSEFSGVLNDALLRQGSPKLATIEKSQIFPNPGDAARDAAYLALESLFFGRPATTVDFPLDLRD